MIINKFFERFKFKANYFHNNSLIQSKILKSVQSYKNEINPLITFQKKVFNTNTKFFSKQENYANPADKFILKKIFYYESGKESFRNLINSFLEEKDRITNLSPISPVLEPLKIDGKKYTFDLSFKDDKNRFVCALIQNNYEENFLEKCYYYASRRQIYEQDFEINFNCIRPLILISILNFIVFPEHVNHISTFEFGCSESNMKLDNLKMIFVELPKFNLDTKDKRGFEWCKYLAYGDLKESSDKDVKNAQKIYKFYNRIE